MSDIDASIQGHFCDIEQYAMLLRCSKKYDMTEWNEWRKANPDIEIRLQGADFFFAYLQKANFEDAYSEWAQFHYADCKGAQFRYAHCEGAHFEEAHCEGANFVWADCERAYFEEAHCEGANFAWADCERAYFEEAHCEGANFAWADCEGANFYRVYCEGALFRFAQFSSSTKFFGCTIDDASDFSYTALESIMVEPGKRARMEYNIRRFAWERRYREQVEPLRRAFQINGLQTVGKILFPLLAWLYLFPVRFFWYVSDYGYSTGRVIKFFIFFILLFALLYTFLPQMLMLNGNLIDAPLPERFLQMLAFATSTMVTLGFSNINVAAEGGKPDLAGMLMVSCNLIVGYFMLAVLVTRLSILFQSMGPGEPRNKK